MVCGFGVIRVFESFCLSAEKEFRFPLGYGSQRPYSATWTVTGAGAFLLNEDKGDVQIRGITTGKIKGLWCAGPV